MSSLRETYRPSLALLTDLYQITMAYSYWKSGLAEREAIFNLAFRHPPFNSGYTLACGLGTVMELLQDFHFDDEDVNYLATLPGNDGEPLFDVGFLEYLKALRFTCSVKGVPEGSVVFPQEPLLRLEGPILQGQLLETALLTIMGFQSLVATKAARVCHAAQGDPVLEFGLRRAQGIDGGLSASRAAYIGGCFATSNVLAGKIFGIPVRGTHAHSWVMLFPDELEAFETYAEVMPNNCVFLVDTYNSLNGVRNAIKVGETLRERGRQFTGIRLDSGDLAYLSIEARKLLDAAGFQETRIIASNDLDEHIITSLKEQGAAIAVWGVGTKLVTAFDQPALGAVYKLAAVRDGAGVWENKVKLSEQAAKNSIPGILNVRRFQRSDTYIGDCIYDERMGIAEPITLVDPMNPFRTKTIPPDAISHDLLVPIFEKGKRVYDSPAIDVIRQHAYDDLRRFHPSVRRFIYPHEYPSGLDSALHEQRQAAMIKMKQSK